MSNEKLRQAVGKVMEETEAEFERNIKKITCDTSFQSPIQTKYVATINNSVYYESGDQVDTISDSNKQVDPSSDPRVDTHIIDRIRKLSVRPITLELVVIKQDIVTSVQETSRNGISPNSLNVKEIIKDVACNSAQVDKIFVRTPSRAIHDQPGVNVDVFSPSRGINSSFAKWSRNIEPLNTSVNGSAGQERNLD